MSTARSVADADKEYAAAITQLIEHTAPPARPIPVPGLGTRAVRIPEWLITQKDLVVCAVTVSRTEKSDPDPAVLETLARSVTQRLGW